MRQAEHFRASPAISAASGIGNPHTVQIFSGTSANPPRQSWQIGIREEWFSNASHNRQGAGIIMLATASRACANQRRGREKEGVA